MKVKFSNLINEAIDYIVLGEKADLLLNDSDLASYNATKNALLEFVKEYENNIVVTTDNKDLLEAAIEYASGLSEEAKIVARNSNVFTECIKAKTKKAVKEGQNDIEKYTRFATNLKLIETSLYLGIVFPLIVEGRILENQNANVDIYAMNDLIKEIAKYVKVYSPCCGGK